MLHPASLPGRDSCVPEPDRPGNQSAGPLQHAPSQHGRGACGRLTYLGLSMLRWGLIPGWARDPAIAYKLINARASSAAPLARRVPDGRPLIETFTIRPPPRTPRSRRSITGCRSFCRRARSRLGSPEVTLPWTPLPRPYLRFIRSAPASTARIPRRSGVHRADLARIESAGSRNNSPPATHPETGPNRPRRNSPMMKICLVPLLSIVLATLAAGVAVAAPDRSRRHARHYRRPRQHPDRQGRIFRIHGIDAPEHRQLCRSSSGARHIAVGTSQRTRLRRSSASSRCGASNATSTVTSRLVAQCFAGSTDLGAEQVRQGWAVAYRKYSRAYVTEEEQARRARRGIWAGEFAMPWDWRRQNR